MADRPAVDIQAIGDVWKYAPVLQNAPNRQLGQPVYAPMNSYEIFLNDLMTKGPMAVYNTLFPSRSQQMLGAELPIAPQVLPSPKTAMQTYGGYVDPSQRIRDIEDATR